MWLPLKTVRRYGAIALLTMGLRWARRRHSRRQIVGRLSWAAHLPAATYRVGAFLITWNPASGGRLQVTHERQPNRELWATVPGLSFAGAARGVEWVTNSRGHFFIVDGLRRICPHQRINYIDMIGGALTIRGMLSSRRGKNVVGYTMTFSAQQPDQLGFTLTLDNPWFNRTYLTYHSEPDERFFGFGTQYSHFNMKGRRLPIFVMEQGIGRGAQPITLGANLRAGAGGAWHTSYAGVPHYITSRLRSLFLETYEYAAFDMRAADRVQLLLFAPQMAGRIVYGESPADLIASYTAYAGRMRPLPDWILEGAIVGMQGGTDAVRHVWAKLREHNMPIVAFWLQDWVGQRFTSFGSQLWWNWELDEERYPQFAELCNDLRAHGIGVMTYINPLLADAVSNARARRNLFQEAAAQGFLVKDRHDLPYQGRVTDFFAGLIDLTNPAAWDWMKRIIKERLIDSGVCGWMADFGEALPYDAHLHSGEPAARYHNRYPEEWARLNREAIEESGRGDELVFFVRSGYRHSPRYATLFWLGDQLVSWDAHDGIKTAVIGLLSSGMSGFSLNHSDIGGYTTITNPLSSYRRDKELLLRWMELNAFTTIYRTHEGNRPEENAQCYTDEETLMHFARFAKVYRAWGFYRKRLVAEASATGLPVVRHLFIHYPDDPNVYDVSYQQFLIGNEILVAPALDPGIETITVYLPAGRWVHLWSGDCYGSEQRGVTITIEAPLGAPGVFYREGAEVGETFVARLREEGIL
jgi:alpha-glucosidase